MKLNRWLVPIESRGVGSEMSPGYETFTGIWREEWCLVEASTYSEARRHAVDGIVISESPFIARMRRVAEGLYIWQAVLRVRWRRR